jgi:hypothetical protein
LGFVADELRSFIDLAFDQVRVWVTQQQQMDEVTVFFLRQALPTFVRYVCVCVCVCVSVCVV